MDAQGDRAGDNFVQRYRNRFVQQWFSCGPGSWDTLLVSSTEIQRCKILLESASRKTADDKHGAKDLAWANHVKQCTLHPDTNEPIPFPFRMSAHVPMNTVLLVGMLSAVTRSQHFLWQTLNQTFNAFQFYSNRNKSNNVSTETLAVATIAAVGGATASVFVMDNWLKKLRARNKSTLMLSILMPLVCAGAAKPFQISIMRADELRSGVHVYNKDQDVCFGRSVVAGQSAVALTIFTRVLYLVQPMVFPPLLYHVLSKKKLFQTPRGSVALNALNVIFIGLCSAVATPMCIAMFDQQSSISLGYLEDDVQTKARKFYGEDGSEGARLYFNKGL